MSGKFTPGPWGHSFEPQSTGFAGDTFMAGPLHCDGTGGFSSVIEGGLVLANDKENEANAHLIAAAPDMFAALEGVEEFLGETGFIGSTLDEVRAALAKARGETA